MSQVFILESDAFWANKSERFKRACEEYEAWRDRAVLSALRCPDCAALSFTYHDVRCPADRGMMPCRDFMAVPMPALSPNFSGPLDPHPRPGVLLCECGATAFQHAYWAEMADVVIGKESGS